MKPLSVVNSNPRSPFSTKNIQECRCGAPTCRGVLGPRPKEREIKDALKPLTENAGIKRKFQQAMGDVAGAVSSKKRKLAVPKSVKKAVQSVSAQAKARLSKAVGAATIVPSAAAKRVSDRSVRHLNRTKGKTTTVKFRSRTIKGAAVAVAAAATATATAKAKAKAPARASGGGVGTIRVNSKSVRKNVVRTIKGAQRRGAVGKSIRVIEE